MELYTWGFMLWERNALRFCWVRQTLKETKSCEFNKYLKTLISVGVTPSWMKTMLFLRMKFNWRQWFLSALVASEVGADQLVILTNVDAIYDRPPTQEGAVRFSVMEKSVLFFEKAEKIWTSSMGRGGISPNFARPNLLNPVEYPLGGAWNVGQYFIRCRQQQSVGTFVPAVRRK